METGKRKRRIYDYSGLLTEDEYIEEEWDATGHECEECLDAELVNGTIDE